MEIERLQLMIGKLMFVGAVVSAAITLVGAIIFLIQHGSEPTHYHFFNPALSQVHNYYSARGLIEIGLYTLVFTQLLRVAFTGWIFIKQRDKWFTVFTAFVFLVLI